MKTVLLVTILFLITQSCKISGLTNDYKGLDNSFKEKIVPLSSFDNMDTSKIYTINANQLNAELLKYPKALVYVFTNGCVSDRCKPLVVYENYGKNTDHKVFLVMNGFRDLEVSLQQYRTGQLFAIDADYYETLNRGTYTRYFENEISGKPTKEKEKLKDYKGNLFFFKEGKLDTILHDLPTI